MPRRAHRRAGERRPRGPAAASGGDVRGGDRSSDPTVAPSPHGWAARAAGARRARPAPRTEGGARCRRWSSVRPFLVADHPAQTLDAPTAVGTCRGGGDAHDRPDLLVREVGSISQVQRHPLTSRQPVDQRPQGQSVIEMLDDLLGPSEGQPAEQTLDPPGDAMLVHDQAIRDAECPRVDVGDRGAALQLVPQAQVDLLDDVGCLFVGRPESARESPQHAAPALVVVRDALLETDRRFVRRDRGDSPLRDAHVLPTQQAGKTQRRSLALVSRSRHGHTRDKPTYPWPVMTDVRPRSPRLPPRFVIRLAWIGHRAMHRLTGGRRGLWAPTAGKWGTMRLATVGRRTGKERSAILGYYEDGPNLITMAMNGWAEPEPAWWLNLQEQPDVTVELKSGPRAVRGRVAEGAERERLWAMWRTFGGDVDGYATRRPTETAVVVLEPRSTAAPATTEAPRLA